MLIFFFPEVCWPWYSYLIIGEQLASEKSLVYIYSGENLVVHSRDIEKSLSFTFQHTQIDDTKDIDPLFHISVASNLDKKHLAVLFGINDSVRWPRSYVAPRTQEIGYWSVAGPFSLPYFHLLL